MGIFDTWTAFAGWLLRSHFHVSCASLQILRRKKSGTVGQESDAYQNIPAFGLFLSIPNAYATAPCPSVGALSRTAFTAGRDSMSCDHLCTCGQSSILTEKSANMYGIEKGR